MVDQEHSSFTASRALRPSPYGGGLAAGPVGRWAGVGVVLQVRSVTCRGRPCGPISEKPLKF